MAGLQECEFCINCILEIYGTSGSQYNKITNVSGILTNMQDFHRVYKQGS